MIDKIGYISRGGQHGGFKNKLKKIRNIVENKLKHFIEHKCSIIAKISDSTP